MGAKAKTIKKESSVFGTEWACHLVSRFICLSRTVQAKEMTKSHFYHSLIFGYTLALRDAKLITDHQRIKLVELSDDMIWKGFDDGPQIRDTIKTIITTPDN